MILKYIYTLLVLLTLAAIAAGQGSAAPRDADEEHAWRLYNQYKESRRVADPLDAQIKAKFNDALMAAYGALAGKAVDPGDVAEVRALREKQEMEQKRQADILAAWERKFYWRYGDLRWFKDKIRDSKTGREMDRIEFALTYIPFKFTPDPNVRTTASEPEKPAASPNSTSLTLELPGYWGHLSYTITGARLDPPTGGDRGKVAGRQYTGELAGGTLTVSGTAVSDNPSSGPGSMDYYEIVVSVSVGKETKEYGYIAQKGEKLNKSFSLSVPVTPGQTGSFSISLIEQNANYGPHGWRVGGSLKPGSSGSSVSRVTSPAVRKPVPLPVEITVPAAEPKVVFNSGNDYAVSNGGEPPSFSLKAPTVISQIISYHWNDGKGSNGGTIALRDNTGRVYGPWVVSVRNKVYWEVNRPIKLPAGTYTVIDSEPTTWAQNAGSNGKGMVTIKAQQ